IRAARVSSREERWRVASARSKGRNIEDMNFNTEGTEAGARRAQRRERATAVKNLALGLRGHVVKAAARLPHSKKIISVRASDAGCQGKVEVLRAASSDALRTTTPSRMGRRPESGPGVIFELLGQFFDLLRLLEDGDRKNIGGVERIDLGFEVLHFGKKPRHRFAKLFFLRLQSCALRDSGCVHGILRVLRFGGRRRIDRSPAPGCGYGRRWRLKDQKRAGDASEVFEKGAAGIEHNHLP